MSKYSSPAYTQIANDLLDGHIKELSEAELKVLLVIFRQTLGYHRTKKDLSISYLVEATGLSKSSVINASQSLEDKEHIEAVRQSGKSTVYEILWTRTPPTGTGITSPKFRQVEEETSPKSVTGTSIKSEQVDDETSLKFIPKERKELKEKKKESIISKDQTIWTQILTQILNTQYDHNGVGPLPKTFVDYWQKTQLRTSEWVGENEKKVKLKMGIYCDSPEVADWIESNSGGKIAVDTAQAITGTETEIVWEH